MTMDQPNQPLGINQVNSNIPLAPVPPPKVLDSINNEQIKPSFNKLPLIIAGVLIVLLILGGLAYFKWNNYFSSKLGVGNSQVSPKTIEPSVFDSSDPEIAKYDKDSNDNAIPDFVEIALGYDPMIDNCAQKECGDYDASTAAQLKKTNTLLILDSSGSMALAMSGETRMSVAKSVIKEWISSFKNTDSVSLMVYGHKGSNNTADKTISCQGIEIIYPLSTIDKNTFNAAVDSFDPKGWTPIADSLLKAQKEVFAGHEQENNRIILVSDGTETCDGSPTEAAKQLKDSNINVIIDVIGFNADAASAVQLKGIAQAGGGKYYSADTKQELTDSFMAWKTNLFNLMEQGVCNARSSSQRGICLSGMVWGHMIGYQGKGAFNYLTDEYCRNLKEIGKIAESQKCIETKEKIIARWRVLDKENSADYQEKYDQNQKLEDENNKYLTPTP